MPSVDGGDKRGPYDFGGKRIQFTNVFFASSKTGTPSTAVETNFMQTVLGSVYCSQARFLPSSKASTPSMAAKKKRIQTALGSSRSTVRRTRLLETASHADMRGDWLLSRLEITPCLDEFESEIDTKIHGTRIPFAIRFFQKVVDAKMCISSRRDAHF